MFSCVPVARRGVGVSAVRLAGGALPAPVHPQVRHGQLPRQPRRVLDMEAPRRHGLRHQQPRAGCRDGGAAGTSASPTSSSATTPPSATSSPSRRRTRPSRRRGEGQYHPCAPATRPRRTLRPTQRQVQVKEQQLRHRGKQKIGENDSQNPYQLALFLSAKKMRRHGINHVDRVKSI